MSCVGRSPSRQFIRKRRLHLRLSVRSGLRVLVVVQAYVRAMWVHLPNWIDTHIYTNTALTYPPLTTHHSSERKPTIKIQSIRRTLFTKRHIDYQNTFSQHMHNEIEKLSSRSATSCRNRDGSKNRMNSVNGKIKWNAVVVVRQKC